MSDGRSQRTGARRPSTKAERDRAIVGTGEATDDHAAREVRRDSDALLDAVRELHDLEREKRRQKVSTPEFHDAARHITDRSRDIFRLAAEEERAGDETDRGDAKTINDVRP